MKLLLSWLEFVSLLLSLFLRLSLSNLKSQIDCTDFPHPPETAFKRRLAIAITVNAN